jgi:replication-associated recombination protein RarA
MVFYGEHGCGKTSILARIATESRKWLANKQQDDQVRSFWRKNQYVNKISPIDFFFPFFKLF